MARLLIADDDPDYCEAFEIGMGALGHDVTGATVGDNVIKIVDDKGFDVIFLDVMISGGGAITLLRKIKNLYSDIPVVIISGQVKLFDTPVFRDGFREAQALVAKSSTLDHLNSLALQLSV